MSQIRLKQQLNGLGWFGAAVFVGAPTLAGFLWQSSVSEYARKLSLFGSSGADLAAGELYAPGLYIALSAIALAGLVMVVIGRDYISDSLN